MKKKLIITYASRFPKRSGYEGQETHFESLIKSGYKQHTIRENYDYWKERLERDPENTLLCQRMWTGQPRKSLQFEVNQVPCTMVAYQTIQLHKVLDGILLIDGLEVPLDIVARHDGLKPEVFIDWFKSFAGDDKPCILISPLGQKYIMQDQKIVYQ